jgi:DNA topoisomerase I
VTAAGAAIRDEEHLERIRALAIPPAWQEVWISPNPGARIQATGVDAAGRTQYRYHASFRAARERAKFERLLEFAKALPAPERRPLVICAANRTSTTGRPHSPSDL